MASPSIPPLVARLRDCLARASDARPSLSSPGNSPACCVGALQQLAAASRDDGGDAAAQFRAALVADDALGGIESTRSGQSLLELLLVMTSASSDAEQSAALLETAVRSLMILPTLGLPPRRHDRLVQLALEVSASVLKAASSALPSGDLHTLAVKSVCELLRRPEEDAVALVMGTKVLASLLRDQSGADASFLELSKDSVATLVRLLLRTPSQRVELVQSICELLLLVADQPEMIQAMVSHQVIRALALLLRKSRDAPGVVLAALQLLHRVTRDAHVQGQIINEGLISELFQGIRRNFDTPQVTTVACAVLATVMEFADDCRLDLSPFLDVQHCISSVLIKAAAYRVDDADISSSVVRCLVSASSNPADLPQLINATTIEGLLALFMSATSGEARSILADGLHCIITLLPRATINAFEIKDESTTLPALFLCLRSYREDLLFVSQVFAIVTRHWKAQGQEVQSIAGYVEIAVDRTLLALTRESPSWMIEVAELCNFLREILLTENGSCVVMNCGGIELLASLRVNLSTESATTPLDQAHGPVAMLLAATRIAVTLVGLLESLQPAAPTQTQATVNTEPEASEATAVTDTEISKSPRRPRLEMNDRPGDSDYADYNALRSESGMCKPRRSVSHSPPELPRPYSTPSLHANVGPGTDMGMQMATKMTDEEEDERPVSGESGVTNEVDEGGEGASDASDADGDDDDGDSCVFKLSAEEEAALADPSSDAGLYEAGDDEDGAPVEGRAVATTIETAVSGTACPSGHQHCHQMPDALMVGSLTAFGIDPSQLKDGQWSYISTNGIRFPKHPIRSKRGLHAAHPTSSTDHENEDLVWSVPEHEEPCYRPDPEAAAQFVAEATVRRALFDAADATSRARTVYKCASLHELLRRRAQSAAVHRHEPALTAPSTKSIAQDGKDADDSDAADCPYQVPHDSPAFADSSHDSLTFDSMFESGNLARAIRIGESEYDLVLRPDLRTNGHMQWFYFAISNAQPTPPATNSRAVSGTPSIGRRQYRFNIINLCKPDSLFNHGLQPVIYSVRDALEKNVGWRRGGRDVHYFSNQYLRTRVSSGGSTTSNGSTNSGATGSGACYYTLTFTLEFSRQDDTYLIAHSFPYTLQMHRLHMDSLLSCLQRQDDPINKNNRHRQPVERPLQTTSRPILRREELCKTLGGTSCELLTISEFAMDASNIRELDLRRAVVITARVHPGEPQASWMMRGVIDFLVGDSDVARALRRMFVFHLVPMLNPDGVYYGNNRCSLSACDLNRQWLTPSAETHPTIFHAKQLIAREHSTRGVVFYCDLHGHSRKHNVFMYGCDTKKRPNPRARVFPRRLATRPRSFLSLPDCSFKVSKDKEATARVVLAYSLEIPWSFTLEASFCGTNLSSLSGEGCEVASGVHFTTQNFHEVGAALCEAIFVNCVTDGSIRERLCAMVDDRSADFPRIIEQFVREAALAAPGSVGDKSKANFKPASSESKVAGRSKMKRTSGGSSRSVNTDGASSQINGARNVRRLSRTPTQPTQPSPRQVLPLRKSSSIVVPETVIPVVGAGIDTSAAHIAAPFDLVSMTSPRARLSGKKTRIKKAKSTMGRSCHDARSSILHRSPTEADCLNATHAFAMEESRIPIGLAASSRKSATRIGPLWPSIASSFCNEGSVETNGFAAVRTAPSTGGAPLPDLGFQSVREAPYVMLPASASPRAGIDPTTTASSLASRSPKPPASRLRFRGAGRQYAAVSSGYQPQQHRSTVLDLLKADATIIYTYEQNLLNTSTISLRQRSVTSVASPGNTSPGTSNCRLNPLNLERSVTPPRTTATAAPNWPSLS